MLFTFVAFGHVYTSANELLSRFAPATRTFSALKHKLTRSPLRTSSPRKLHNIAERLVQL